MPILRLTDGQKRLLLSLHGVRRHKRLLLEEARWQTGWLPTFTDLWNSLRYWQSHGQGLGTHRSYSPHPPIECPSRRFSLPDFQVPNSKLTRVQRRNELVCRTDAIAQATHAADRSRAH